jgi:helix-turn-helix protein
MEPVMARKMWRTLEPYHGLIYFAPEATAAYEALGVMGFDGYFASRAAPMGAVPAEVVVATFFNFNPAIIHHAIPAAWSATTPEALLAARLDAAGQALRRSTGELLEGASVPRAAELARVASDGCTTAGRPLYAGHARLPWPDDPVLVLWHAITLLREFRGDGHIACLVEAGLDGIDALVFHAASGDVPRAALQGSRQWDDASWDASVASLAARGFVDHSGAFTEAGAALRQHIEDRTDALALGPWEALGEEGCAELRSLVRPLSQAIVGSGTFGLPR